MKRKGYGIHTKKLYIVPQALRDRDGSIPFGAKYCTACKRDVLRNLKTDEPNEEAEENNVNIGDQLEDQMSAGGVSSQSSPVKRIDDNENGTACDEFEPPVPVRVSVVNQVLSTLGKSPTTPRLLRSNTHKLYKLKQITSATSKVLKTPEDPSSSNESIVCNKCSDIRDKVNTQKKLLKKKYDMCKNNVEKLKVLTVGATIMSVRQMHEYFNASYHLCRKAKYLLKTEGIMSSPVRRTGPRLLASTVTKVVDFYYEDDISKTMPGMKDVISVPVSQTREGIINRVQSNVETQEQNKRVKKHKRLILDTLDELYDIFKSKHSDVKISLSSFVKLRPKECVFSNDSNAHSVCVCTKHENFNLMLRGSQLLKMSSDKHLFNNKHEILQTVMCSPPLTDCYLRKCSSCPSLEGLEETLNDIFDFNGVESVTYNQWSNKSENSKFNRCGIETITKSASDFVESLCSSLNTYLPHHHINILQTNFWKRAKETLQDGEIGIQMDFAQNYAFVMQNAAQGYHWNNRQATLHTAVAYYKQNGKIQTYCHVTICEAQDKHDTVTVHLCQSRLIKKLQAVVGNIKSIMYYSDGAASQYKNKKNFINLTRHNEDFKIKASWHFGVTSHCKGPCDGLGGSIKRLAREASLKRLYDNQITTPRRLYEWAIATFEKIYFDYVSEAEYAKNDMKLRQRFNAARTIQGTQKYHSVIPSLNDINLVEMRIYSDSPEYTLCSVV
jgi:hypothetical protein